MSSALVWPCATAAFAVSASIIANARRARPAAGSEAPRSLPWALRWLWRPARLFAAAGLPRAPARAEKAMTRNLERAGLGEWLNASAWTAILFSAVLSGCILALICAALLGASSWLVILVAACGPAWGAHAWLQARAQLRAATLVRELPAAIDLLVLCLESGASIGTALSIAHQKSGAGPLQDLLGGLLRHIRTGRGRAAAFRHVMERLDLPEVTGLLTALIQAETRGISLGPALRAQSTQCIAERFIRAERAAMQAPVKLLMPLLLCIFPCTFIVIAVPIAARLAGQGGP